MNRLYRRRFGKQLYGLGKNDAVGLYDEAKEYAECIIYGRAGTAPPNTERYWKWLAAEITCVPVDALTCAPDDWDEAEQRDFKGRVKGDPLDPVRTDCRIQYLATGSIKERVARLIHEIVEFLLAVRLPTLFDDGGSPLFSISYCGSQEQTDRRHEIAREIENDMVAWLFPPPKRLTRSMYYSLISTAMGEHLNWSNHPRWCPETEHVDIDEDDFCL